MYKYINLTNITNDYKAYFLKSYNIFPDVKAINVILDFYYFNNYVIHIEELHIVLQNSNNLIIDPTWNENSDPPKPDGFDFNKVFTWINKISYDDIPKYIEPSMEYFSRIDAAENKELEIFNCLITKELIPRGSEWRFLS